MRLWGQTNSCFNANFKADFTTELSAVLSVIQINIFKINISNDAWKQSFYFKTASGLSVRNCPINKTSQSHKVAKRNPLPKQADLVKISV